MQEKSQLPNVPPLSGPALVAGINEIARTLGTSFAGAYDPAGMSWSYATWADTANGLVKRRNAANTAWVTIGKLLVDNSDSANVDYDNTASGLAATDVKGAIDEVAIKYSAGIPTTSGTQIDVTGIPAGVKRIVVQFAGVSLTGTSPVCLQLGTSAGVHGSDYAETSTVTNSATVSTIHALLGFVVGSPVSATDANSGKVFLDRFGGTNIWSAHGGTRQNQTRITTVAGYVLIPGGLDRIRLRPYNGTDTFDGGSIVVSWEA